MRIFTKSVCLEIAYLLFLQHVTDSQVSQVLKHLFFGVLVAGILLSIVGAFFSLFTVEIGFWIAVCYARQKTLAAMAISRMVLKAG